MSDRDGRWRPMKINNDMDKRLIDMENDSDATDDSNGDADDGDDADGASNFGIGSMGRTKDDQTCIGGAIDVTSSMLTCIHTCHTHHNLHIS